MRIKDYPIVRVTLTRCRTGNYAYTFWCPFCHAEHSHGGGESLAEALGPRLGHRLAHCWVMESPFKKTGYILSTSPEDKKKWRAELKKQMEEAR